MSKRVKRFVVGSVVVVLVAAAALLLLPWQQEIAADKALRSVATTSDTEATTTEAGDGLAHLRVENTEIDYVVAQASEETGNEFYLTHDYNGEFNSIGCPFVDYRTSLSATHTLMYAHGMANNTILFSELKHVDEQGRFDNIGNAIITYEDGSERTYAPVMAMSVDEEYQLIQTFSFSKGLLPNWLNNLKEDASAISSDAGTTIASAKHVITLVTCTSDTAHQRPRTLVIFVSNE